MYQFEQYVHLIDVDILEHDVQLIKHQQQIYFLVAKNQKLIFFKLNKRLTSLKILKLASLCLRWTDVGGSNGFEINR